MKRGRTAFACALLVLASACGRETDRDVVSYDAGPGWTRVDEILQLGATTFDRVEKYGPNRCVNADLRDGLVASGLVTGVRNVDEALTRVLGDGLVARLFGSRAGATARVSHDVVAGPVHGRGATLMVLGVPCVPYDLGAPPISLITLDLVGFSVHEGRDAVVVFLSGTLDPAARRPILDSIRVTS